MTTEIETKTNIPKSFNESVRTVFDIFSKLESKAKTKLSIKYMRKKMNSGMRNQEDYALRVLGPYLWNCREDITARRVEVFVYRNYDVAVMKLSRTYKFDYKDAVKTISFMKETFSSTDTERQTQISDHICKMLGLYAQYLVARRTDLKAQQR